MRLRPLTLTISSVRSEHNGVHFIKYSIMEQYLLVVNYIMADDSKRVVNLCKQTHSYRCHWWLMLLPTTLQLYYTNGMVAIDSSSPVYQARVKACCETLISQQTSSERCTQTDLLRGIKSVSSPQCHRLSLHPTTPKLGQSRILKQVALDSWLFCLQLML